MKRIIILAAILLLLTSCADNNVYLTDSKFDTDEYLADFDQDLSLSHTLDGICRSDAAYYLGSHSGRNEILFYDIASGISGPLCSKPECAHSDKDCNAATDGIPMGLSVYDKKLYWVSFSDGECAVYSEELDGTDRKTVRNLPKDFCLSGDIIFHRGYIYTCADVETVKNGAPVYSAAVYGADIDGDDAFTVLEKSYPRGSYVSVQTVAYRNSLFISVSVTEDTGAMRTELYEFDTKTRSLKTLDDNLQEFGKMHVDKDGIYFLGESFCRYDLSKKELIELPRFDNDFGSCGITDKYIIGDRYEEDGSITIIVSDFSGETVAHRNLGDIGRSSGRTYLGCIDDKILYQFFGYNDCEFTYILVPFDGEAVVLWEIN